MGGASPATDTTHLTYRIPERAPAFSNPKMNRTGNPGDCSD